MKKNPKVKIKTRKSIAKRFKVTNSGKMVRRGAQNRHLNANKSKRSSRRSKVLKTVPKSFAKKLKKLLSK
jgi:large subunit ribosomal protein L35